MSTLEARVSMADIAALAEVNPSAVSNWRKRYADFPTSEMANGRELRNAGLVATWLDERKIASSDLKADEVLGTTYGARFRKNLGVSPGVPEHLPKVVWRELDKLRGASDSSKYSDLVLSLLYLRICHPSRWSELISAAKISHLHPDITELLMRQADDPEIVDFRAALPTAASETGERRRLAKIIHVLGRIDLQRRDLVFVFAYLRARFAAASGRRGGEFFTPASVVRLISELVVPKPGEHVHDPCCGSGDFLLGASDYVTRHGGSSRELSFSGQALAESSLMIARMNLAVHDLAASIWPYPARALSQDFQAERRFDVIMTNPPFNMPRWSDGHPAFDRRWSYGVPPEHNANFAWLQHVVSSLADGGRAAVIMANGASNSENGAERAIRTAMVEDGAVEGLVALPPQLFYSTAIPVTLWMLRYPAGLKNEGILFIDATSLGSMIERNNRVLTEADIDRIAKVCGHWRGRASGLYVNIPGFSRSVPLEEIREQSYRLNPRSYITSPTVTVDLNGAAEKLRQLRQQLRHLHARSADVDVMVDQQLDRINTWRA